MGSSSSCSKVKKVHKSTQAPLMQNPIPPKPSPSPTPLPHEKFEHVSNIEQYSSIWDPDTKLSSPFQRSLKSEPAKVEHHQKESLNNKWSKKSSTTFESARIESTLDTQTHACINLSSSDKIDDLIKNLNRIHSQLDDVVKRRTEQISTETESLLSHILIETQQTQQSLLQYAKRRQLQEDEHYGQLLQEYISQLDERKAKDLSQIHKELQVYRERIMEESQLKIKKVNHQANGVKTKISRDEQQQAAEKIDLIIGQLQKISVDEKHQHLGSEILTKTNVTTNANIGTKAVGQGCNFDFEEEISSDNHTVDRRSSQYSKKTMPTKGRNVINEREN